MGELISGVVAHGDTVSVGLLLTAVLSVILRQLYTGTLLFRRQYEEMRADKDAELARTITYYEALAASKDEQAVRWQNAYDVQSVALKEQAVILREQLELARTANHLLKSLPTSRVGATGEGSPDATP